MEPLKGKLLLYEKHEHENYNNNRITSNAEVDWNLLVVRLKVINLGRDKKQFTIRKTNQPANKQTSTKDGLALSLTSQAFVFYVFKFSFVEFRSRWYLSDEESP